MIEDAAKYGDVRGLRGVAGLPGVLQLLSREEPRQVRRRMGRTGSDLELLAVRAARSRMKYAHDEIGFGERLDAGRALRQAAAPGGVD